MSRRPPYPRLSRRQLLRGLAYGGGTVAVGLPLFEAMLNSRGDALADGSSLPGRFGVFFWGNGVLPERWVPEQSGEEYELSDQLAPLAGLRQHFSVVSGTRVETGNPIAHASGAGGILSGTPLVLRGGEEYTFGAPSIDQLAAAALGGSTRFRSLEVAVQPEARGYSFAGPDQRLPPEWSPYQLYRRLFGPGFVEPGDEPVVSPRLALRRSVLDAVMQDTQRLSQRLGQSDRKRLDQHLSGVRDLERRLALIEENPPQLEACRRADAPAESYPDIDGRPQLAERNQALARLLAMALACDQTRVFSYWFSDSVNNMLFAGARAGHHRLTHDEPGDQPQVHSIVEFIVGQLAVLMEELAAIPEGGGSLLDNCSILATTDVSYGRQHSLEDFPILCIGGGCGRLRQGIHHRSLGFENASKVGLSLLRASGVPLTSFGNEAGRVDVGLGAIER